MCIVYMYICIYVYVAPSYPELPHIPRNGCTNAHCAIRPHFYNNCNINDTTNNTTNTTNTLIRILILLFSTALLI